MPVAVRPSSTYDTLASCLSQEGRGGEPEGAVVVGAGDEDEAGSSSRGDNASAAASTSVPSDKRRLQEGEESTTGRPDSVGRRQRDGNDTSMDRGGGRGRKTRNRRTGVDEVCSECPPRAHDVGVGPALGEPLDPKSGHLSFRRPCFQRGEAWENAKIAVRPTFVPENLCNQQEIRVSHALVTHLDTL